MHLRKVFLISNLLRFYQEIASGQKKSVFNNMAKIAYKKLKKQKKNV